MTSLRKPFQHTQTAHCETGVAAGLLTYGGCSVSEPLAFGIGGGLFFLYLPFLQMNGSPTASFRHIPGIILKRTAKAVNLQLHSRAFRNPLVAMSALDEYIDQGVPVGLQVGVFHLPYFPDAYRFHFNAHHIIVIGRQNGEYLVSDPTLEVSTTISPADLQRVRFAKGVFAPKGKMYVLHPGTNDTADLARAVRKGIQSSCRNMLKIPIPLFGVKGIRFLAKSVRSYKQKYGLKQAGRNLAQIIRFQEEIGTGGGGFRFMFAAFIQEAAAILKSEAIAKQANGMTKSGDLWRAFAVQAAQIFRHRHTAQSDFDHAADLLNEIASVESAACTALLSELKR